jgi:hypothetical protein
MTRDEWIYCYRTAWSLRRPDLGAEHFTQAILDEAYEHLGETYSEDPEGAVQHMADEWYWESPEGL